jgi:hypothetical protein
MSKIMELKLAYLETEVRRDLSTVLYEYSAFVDDVTPADKKPFTSYEFKCMLERIERFREESTIEIKETKAEEPKLGKITATAFPSGGITNGLFFGSYEEKTLREILTNNLEDDISNFYKFKTTSSSFISILNDIQDFQNASLEDYAKLNCTTEITKTMLPLDNVKHPVYRIENYLREDDAIFINYKIRKENKDLHDIAITPLIADFNAELGPIFKIENGIQPYGSQLAVPKSQLELMQAGKAVEISLVDNPSKVISTDELTELKDTIESRYEKINDYFEFFSWLKAYNQSMLNEHDTGTRLDTAIDEWEAVVVPEVEETNPYDGNPTTIPGEEEPAETNSTPSLEDVNEAEQEKAEKARIVKNLMNNLISIEADMRDPDVKENAIKIQTVYKYSDYEIDLNTDIEEVEESETQVIGSRHKRIMDEIRRNLSNDIIDVKCFPSEEGAESLLYKSEDERLIYCEGSNPQDILQFQFAYSMMTGVVHLLTTYTANSYNIYDYLVKERYKNIPELEYVKVPDDPSDRTYLQLYKDIYDEYIEFLGTAVAHGDSLEDILKDRNLEQIKKYIDQMHEILLTLVTGVIKEREYTFDDLSWYIDQHASINQYYGYSIDEDRAIMCIYKKDTENPQP